MPNVYCQCGQCDGMLEAPAPEPTVHDLKLDARWFPAVLDGTKTFEIRKDDRGYAVGDVLVLRERAATGTRTACEAGCIHDDYVYTGRTCRRIITFILRHEDHEGVAPGFVVLGLGEASGDAP